MVTPITAVPSFSSLRALKTALPDWEISFDEHLPQLINKKRDSKCLITGRESCFR